MNNIKIILENGIELSGKSFGFKRDTYASFIFNTSIVGYQEALTDPSYTQEALVMSFPVQGIYGINDFDSESNKCYLSALVVSSYEDNFSNNHAKYSLENFLIKNKIQGIYDIDTRFLIKTIRTTGSLKGAIVGIDSPADEIIKNIRNNKWYSPVKKISIKEQEIINSNGTKTIVLYDFGVKKNIINEMVKRKYKVIKVPYDTKATVVKNLDPEFVFLSNGPGDPAELTKIISEVKKMMLNNIPIVGICLGHQLISLALGAKTYKLKFGHHSTNHPVKDLQNNKVYITSQNHNYSVIKESYPKDIEIFLQSLNDDSVEGIKSKERKIISTQFHPESSPGPRDANSFFDMFINFVKEVK